MNLTKKVISFAFLALALSGITGCAAKYNFQSVQTEKGSSEYKVELKMEKRFKTLNPTAFNTISIYLNGKKVLKGPLDGTETGDLEGIFDNKKLELECGRVGIFDAHSRCIVHLGNIRLGKYEIVQRVNPKQGHGERM